MTRPFVQELAELASEASPPAGMPTRVIAIDGFGGSGKSTLAAGLAEALGDCPLVQADDFASWNDPLGWWPRMLDQVFEPLGRGEQARYQRWDWDAGQLGEWRELPLVPAFLVVEGVSAARATFQSYLSWSVWVATPSAERLRRGLERDGEHARDQWERWMDAEAAWTAEEHPQLRVDRVVSGQADGRYGEVTRVAFDHYELVDGGRRLQVWSVGGLVPLDRVDVVEQSGEVVVTVWERWPGLSDDPDEVIAVPAVAVLNTAELAVPGGLGGRRVRDGVTGRLARRGAPDGASAATDYGYLEST